jgi:hypothetical protein
VDSEVLTCSLALAHLPYTCTKAVETLAPTEPVENFLTIIIAVNPAMISPVVGEEPGIVVSRSSASRKRQHDCTNSNQYPT